MKKWIVLDKSNKESPADIVKILLKNRGIKGKKDIDEFLNPSMSQLTLKNVGLKKKELDKAVARIKKAIKKGESIVVYTDYDVDGVCGGAIVWEALFALSAKAMPYIPHRTKEGYGLSKKGIDFVKKKYGASLIITVDHGVSAGGKIGYAKKLGIDTIVLDHHLLPEKLPSVSALIHTTKLSAGGIAWFFADYLLSQLRKQIKDKFNDSNLELAGLATIADLVPLLGSNRIIVKHGLKYLNKTERLGLNALMKEVGVKKGEIGVYEVGFMIGPRINASGRIGHALEALKLICTKNEERARKLSEKLNLINRERRKLTVQSTDHAISVVEETLVRSTDKEEEINKLLFVEGPDYNEGVIGLIAGRLVDKFYRPAIVVSVGEKYCKASARSISGFNIVEIIRSQSHLLEDVGGHPMAAGFTVATKNLDALKKELMEIVGKELDEDKLVKSLKVDLELDLSNITDELFVDINSLSPFGMGNPEPTFVSSSIEVVNAFLVGKDKKHLKMYLKQGNGGVFEAIGFGMGEMCDQLSPNAPIDIVYTINENTWNGRSSLQLKLKDIKV